MDSERKIRQPLTFALCVASLTLAMEATAAVAVISESHSIYAETTKGTSTDFDSDTTDPSPASVSATLNNSVTTVTTSWGAVGAGTDTLIYSASGTLVESKVPAAKPGVDHVGTSLITMVFQPDADGTFSFTGSLTDVGITGTDDPFTWSIVGGALNVSGTETSFPGPVTGSVVAGVTYTLTVDVSMFETINNEETRSRTWDTELTVIAVPEPSTVGFLCSAAVFLHYRRRKSK